MRRILHPLRAPVILVIVSAVGMGFISGKLLLFKGSVMNVLPWGVLALGAAALASTRRQALILGGIFGFVVSFSFLCFNNTGTKTLSAAVVVALLAAVAALFGLVCGIFLGWLSWKIRRADRAHIK